MLALSAALALACGQTTHVWTALHAVDHLADGPLKELLSDPDARRALISGTMFPDGGYSPLVGHEYGETSHWEPFQDRWLAWVRDHPDDRREAFLYGLAAHGLGDQVYDAAYLYRGDEGQPDEATDVVIASLWGGHAPNEHFVPYDELVPLFADAGVAVDVETMERGMSSLDFAIAYVAIAAEDPEEVAARREEAPWATSHLEETSMPGAPICLGKAIALYWQVLERRLDGEAPRDLVLTSWPEPGAFGWPREGGDALISVVFARAMEEATVEEPGRVTLTGPDGDVPVDAWMYYREASNVLDVQPLEVLAEDAEYTLTLFPGMLSIGGDALDTWSLTFSTAPPPQVEDPPQSCGCRQSGLGGRDAHPTIFGLLLLIASARRGVRRSRSPRGT